MAENSSQTGEIVARFLGLKRSELKNLADQGVAILTGPNQYDLPATVRSYIDFLRTRDTRAPTQLEVAEHLDMSERNAREVLKVLGIDWTQSNIDAIRVAYIRDMREKAAGRGGEEQRERAIAQTREAQASAQLKELAYFKEVGMLAPIEVLQPLIENWAVHSRSETLNACEKLRAEIKSKHDLELDQALIDDTFGPAFIAIASYPQICDGDADAGGGEVETAEENSNA